MAEYQKKVYWQLHLRLLKRWIYNCVNKVHGKIRVFDFFNSQIEDSGVSESYNFIIS